MKHIKTITRPTLAQDALTFYFFAVFGVLYSGIRTVALKEEDKEKNGGYF